MKKRNHKASKIPHFLLLHLLVFFAQNTWAAEVYVAPASGTDFTESELENVTTLIRTTVTETKGNRLVEKNSNKASAREISLKPTLMRIGSDFVLTLSKEQNGETFSAKLKFDRLENLDRIATRLTQSVLNNETPEPTGRESTQESSEKQIASSRTYFGFGGVYLGNLNSSGVGYSFGVGQTFDLNRVAIRVLGELDIQGTALFSSVGAGVNYYFNTSNYAPYVSGDFGLGFAKIDGGSWTSGASVFGFVFGLGGGIELFRHASINMDIGFRAGFLMNQNGNGIPTAYSLRLGLYF